MLLIITGPTGVGKTDLALKLAEQIPSEIVNIDVGQFYKPLEIGTAKPDWRNEPVPHHLFDVIDTPKSLTVVQYRKKVCTAITAIQARGNLPILVGGSGFYINSLFFPPTTSSEPLPLYESTSSSVELWHELNQVDPDRAKNIHENDRYRLGRALAIWHTHGVKPSTVIPTYDPVDPDYMVVVVNRDRDELYERINERTHHMIDAGWPDEVVPLLGTPWEQFLRDKKIIGYDDILDYLHSPQAPADKELLITRIQQKTRNYAKRQVTYFTMLSKKLRDQNADAVEWVNLTLSPLDLYLNQLVKRIQSDK